MRNVIRVIIVINFAYLVKSANKVCFQQDTTWSADGQLEAIPQVNSVQECFDLCLKNDECDGYTWYGNFQKFENFCFLFSELGVEYDCQNCISGKAKDTDGCFCGQKSGECTATGENFIKTSPSESELGCVLQCYLTQDCQYYTWYSSESNLVKNVCFLFSKCEEVQPCDAGCNTGNENFYLRLRTHQ